jgi:uncharacterized protein
MRDIEFGVNQPRFYRFWIKEDDFSSFEVKVGETDLHIKASKSLKTAALASVKRHRKPIEDTIRADPEFGTTLAPYPLSKAMKPIVKGMVVAARKVGVGPMAAVAGAIAEYVGKDLLENCDEVIVENGGDVFIQVKRRIRIGIYAGPSPFTKRLAFDIKPEETPLGVCTSSGTVGPSLSLGASDATIALAKSTAFADACATAIGNLIKDENDIPGAIEYAKGIKGLYGLVLIKGKKLGAWGKVRFLVPQQKSPPLKRRG